ncbi:MAG: NADH-quinone oxidoreductase subunit H [Candidatus Latescibacteria bacterium]|nr:NADH-quinone oxidoreductase subunit H [Candidatus Latescibacterota bacterium]
MKIAFWFLVFPGFLFTAIVGMLLTWVDRKVTARIHWRIGPPWYQPFADFFKLLAKETMIPAGTPKFIFLLAPMLGVIAMTIIAVMLFAMNFMPDKSFVGDLIVLIYLLALPPLGLILGGSASKNPLSAVGASREMTLYFAYELPFLAAILIAVIKTGGQIRIGEMVAFQQLYGPILYSFSGVIAMLISLFAMQAKLGYVPFDIAEAEQEIMAGPLLEYSGVALAMFKLTKAMMFFILPCFLITIFWGGLASRWAIPKLLLLVVLVILLKNTNPRLRIDQALKFFWIGLVPFAIVGIILAFYNL